MDFCYWFSHPILSLLDTCYEVSPHYSPPRMSISFLGCFYSLHSTSWGSALIISHEPWQISVPTGVQTRLTNKTKVSCPYDEISGISRVFLLSKQNSTLLINASNFFKKIKTCTDSIHIFLGEKPYDPKSI